MFGFHNTYFFQKIKNNSIFVMFSNNNELENNNTQYIVNNSVFR